MGRVAALFIASENLRRLGNVDGLKRFMICRFETWPITSPSII